MKCFRLQYTFVKVVALAAILFANSSCKQETTGEYHEFHTQGHVEVVATVGMIADIVREVGGAHANVSALIGEGVDPHLYKPTRDDVIKLQRADMVFYNGLFLEGKMGDILVQLARTGKPVYAVTEAILGDAEYVLVNDSEHFDPHVWMDVRGWIKATEVVVDALVTFDAMHRELFEAQGAAYIEKLKTLDEYTKTVMKTIPEYQRILVTAHDAFNYMGRAYGLEVLGIQGISTESEAGVKDIENLVDLMVERQIPAVFVETSVADKNVKALIEGASAKGHDVIIGGELFSDAMGPSGSYEGTYIGMIDHNVSVIARALGGEAPAGGFQGRLNLE